MGLSSLSEVCRIVPHFLHLNTPSTTKALAPSRSLPLSTSCNVVSPHTSHSTYSAHGLTTDDPSPCQPSLSRHVCGARVVRRATDGDFCRVEFCDSSFIVDHALGEDFLALAKVRVHPAVVYDAHPHPFVRIVREVEGQPGADTQGPRLNAANNRDRLAVVGRRRRGDLVDIGVVC